MSSRHDPKATVTSITCGVKGKGMKAGGRWEGKGQGNGRDRTAGRGRDSGRRLGLKGRGRLETGERREWRMAGRGKEWKRRDYGKGMGEEMQLKEPREREGERNRDDRTEEGQQGRGTESAGEGEGN